MPGNAAPTQYTSIVRNRTANEVLSKTVWSVTKSIEFSPKAI
jgi:hypothetical protein